MLRPSEKMRNQIRTLRNSFIEAWQRFWIIRAGPHGFGLLCGWIGSRFTAPYHKRCHLASYFVSGFIAPSAVVKHNNFTRGTHVFVGDRTFIYQTGNGGKIALMDQVHVYGNSFIETGMNGNIHVSARTHIQPGCHMHAYLSDILIGHDVEIAADCGFYSYDHRTDQDLPIMQQGLRTKGDIVVGDGAWLGHRVTILSGVTIGEGAMIAAGSVVTSNIPKNAIAAGSPARVIKVRNID